MMNIKKNWFIKYYIVGILPLLGFSAAKAQQVKHVILISIDGFHPDMYLDKSWPSPNMQQLLKKGTYADHLLSVFPSYTYPSHTAMVTGAIPRDQGFIIISR